MNKKIQILRRKLDKLDDSFLNLVKKRTLLVDQVLKTKKFKKQIIDKKRIKLILKKIKTKSLKKNIDITVSNRIWKAMISSYIDYEFRKFKKK